jgi:hypothetical protein
MSENSFHTPGPWSVTWDPDQYGHYILDQARQEQEEWVFAGEDEEFDQRQEIANLHDAGNSRLMQGSPAMYRLLTFVANRLNLEEQENPGGKYILAAYREEINQLLAEIKEV